MNFLVGHAWIQAKDEVRVPHTLNVRPLSGDRKGSGVFDERTSLRGVWTCKSLRQLADEMTKQGHVADRRALA
ncbi:hypothetical protein [Nannocystis punicea]|uniref:Uncharacterized protein n=1 Tax=Nannocystis punicea TaxID=2995304 RepID=A0ABY7GY70_9BACT|nr:hypothetical protein [Nannocystis poenicansa]WAS91917.1 hypothetical protein O0S08_37520 [Nannocystis poenicansa]